MVILFSLPVRLVLGATCRMPLASMSKLDLDLRHAARRRRDALEVELAEQLVARGHLALALVDLDRHRRLVVVGGGEGLRELGRDGRVLL